MPKAPLPTDEAQRLAALRSYEVLDTEDETCFDRITRLAALVTGCPIALVSLVDRDRQWFKSREGLSVCETSRDSAFCAHAILSPERILLVPDAREDARFADNPLVTGPFGLRFYAGAPLVDERGAALGSLCVIDTAPKQLDATQQEALAHLAHTVITNFELRRALRHAVGAATTDMLTGLANRTAMTRAIDDAIRQQQRNDTPFSLVFFDLDGFKAINDTRGHAAGDQILCEVASAMLENTREGDLAGRFAGDEFVLLLANTDLEASAVAQRVLTSLESRSTMLGMPVTASAGLATFLTPPANVAAALAAADHQMYAAKAAGKNRVLSQMLTLHAS